MKSASDPRHRRREKRIQALFSYSFSPNLQPSAVINPIIEKLTYIDDLISRAAPEWPLHKINRVDLAILRLAVYELSYDPSIPPKVAIDEAVELGKRYGAESSPAFINGVLGTVLRTLGGTVNEHAS